MKGFRKMGEAINIISTISTVLTVGAVIWILAAAALGLRKSWKHAVIKLGRTAAAVLLAFITAKILTPTVAEFTSVLINSLGTEFSASPTVFEFVSGIPGAIIMPFIFGILFLNFNWILAIPAIFVKKAVLKDEISAKKEAKDAKKAAKKAAKAAKKAEPAYEDEADSQNGDAEESNDDKKPGVITWKSRLIGAGVRFANTFIFIAVLMLPLSCLLATLNDGISAISLLTSDTAAEETEGNEESDDITAIIAPITENPVIVVSSNPIARLIYSNLTEIRVGDTVCYLDKEIVEIGGFIENLLKLTETDISNFGEEQKLAIKNLANYVSQSEFRCTLILEFMSSALPETEEPSGDNALMDLLMGIFTDATPETFGTDLNALADMFGVLIDHSILSGLAGDGSESDPEEALAKFTGKEFLEDLLTAVNPSQNCRNILPSIINMLFAGITGGEATGAPANMPELTAEQIATEAAAISETISSFMDMADSLSDGSEGSLDDLSSLDISAFGKLYDKSQESIILKDNFKALFVSLLKSGSMEGIGDVLANHIENDPDLELTKVLTAVQQLAKIFGRYEDGNSATDLAELKTDLDSLINSVDEHTADIITEMLSTDAFTSSSVSGGSEGKATELLSSVINVMIDMENLSDEELHREAQALDYLMKISNSKSESVGSVFEAEGDNADDMMDAILNSKISVSAINELAYDENGNLTGNALEISEDLTEEDKQDVRNSAESYYKENVGSMNAEEKETLQKNMNAIASIFGNDLSNDFSVWDSEING